MLIPKSVFSIAAAASREVGRYILNGVRFFRDSEGKPHAEATDGKNLVTVTWEEDTHGDYPHASDPVPSDRLFGGHEMVVHANKCAEVQKLVPKHSRPILENAYLVESDVYETQAKFSTNDLDSIRKLETARMEGVWPDFSQVIPKGKPKMTVGVHPAKLKKMAEMLMKIAEVTEKQKDDVWTDLILYGEEKPIELRHTNKKGVTVRSLLMPLVKGKS